MDGREGSPRVDPTLTADQETFSTLPDDFSSGGFYGSLSTARIEEKIGSMAGEGDNHVKSLPEHARGALR